MSRMISTIMLLIVVVVVGILFYRVMVGFFVPLFLAVLLVVIFRPIHEWMGYRLGRPRAAALATTAAILLVVLLPTLLTISIAAAQATRSLSRVNYNSVALAVQRTRQQLGLEIDNITPFLRIRQVVESFGELPTLGSAKQLKAAEDRVREFEQLLRTLERDFAPLSPAQTQAFADTTAALEQLKADVAVLAAEQAAEEAAASNGSAPPPGRAPPTSEANATAEAPPAAEADELSLEPDFSGDDALSPEPDFSGEGNSEADAAEAFALVDYRSPVERFQRTLVQLDDHTRELTTLLLGGTLPSQLKLWANPTDEDIARWIQQGQLYLQSRLLLVTSATGEFLIQTLIGLGILIISVYFFLVDGPGMVRTLMRLSPLDDRYEQELLLEFDRTSRAVVLATVLSALAQGILATFGYYIAGLESIVLLFLITTFMALIPFLGAASVWLPCVLWLGLVQERWTAAIALLIYGAVVVSAIDNVIKVFVLHGRSQLHPLLALLSVLGGVQVFGPIGVLVGPMVVVFLQTTLEILNQELIQLRTGASEEEAIALATTGVSADNSPVGEVPLADSSTTSSPPQNPPQNPPRQTRGKSRRPQE